MLLGLAGAGPLAEVEGYLDRARREIPNLDAREGQSCLGMLVACYADAGRVDQARRLIDQAEVGNRPTLQRALVMSVAIKDPAAAQKLAEGIEEVGMRDSAYRFVALHLAETNLAGAQGLIGQISDANRPAAWHELALRLIARDDIKQAEAILEQLPAGAEKERLRRQIKLARWLEGAVSELPAKAKKAGVDLASLSVDLRNAVGRMALRGKTDKAQALALYVSDPFQRGMAYTSIALAQARQGDMKGYAKSIQSARDSAALADDAFRPMLEATILRTDSEFGDVEEIRRQVKLIQADPDDLRQALVPQIMTQLCLRRGAYDAIVDLCLEDKTPLRSLFIQNVAQELAQRGQTATVDKLMARLRTPEDRARACLGAAMGVVGQSNSKR